MEIYEHIAALRREGDLLATAAANVDLDTPIPTCPEWQMRDLVLHTGGIHRWAALHVAERRTAPVDGFDEGVKAWPDDGELIDWFRAGHAALVHTLETAEPELTCWTFLPAPSSLAFWARRQAHETGIHRADAESPSAMITPFPPAFAVDGIDELLFGFASRPGGKLRTDPPKVIHLSASDSDRQWLLHIGPAGLAVQDGAVQGGALPAMPDCAVHATASDLHLLLWNRRTAEGMRVRGDNTLLDLWRQSVRIR